MMAADIHREETKLDRCNCRFVLSRLPDETDLSAPDAA
jgi:hypothetical protein